jgi:hypothetical protein
MEGWRAVIPKPEHEWVLHQTHVKAREWTFERVKAELDAAYYRGAAAGLSARLSETDAQLQRTRDALAQVMREQRELDRYGEKR